MPGTLTTVTVTGELDRVTGDDFSAAIVRFELYRADVDTVDKITLSTAPWVIELDGDGAFSVGLWPNSRGTMGSVYRVTLSYFFAGKYIEEVLGYVSVPEGDAPHDLSDLLDVGATPAQGIYTRLTEAQYNAILSAATGAQSASEAAAGYAGAAATSAAAAAGHAALVEEYFDGAVWYVADDATSVTIGVGDNAVISDPGPGPYDTVTLEVV